MSRLGMNNVDIAGIRALQESKIEETNAIQYRYIRYFELSEYHKSIGLNLTSIIIIDRTDHRKK